MMFGLPYWLILVLPLGGSLLVPLVGKFSHKLRDWIPSIFMGAAMLLCWSLLLNIGYEDQTSEWAWIPALGLNFGVLLDPLSIIMAVLSSTLCFLIYVYSTEYMKDEEDKDRFYFMMLAFGGGMLTLVLSNNILIAFVGWEIMGFCSYGLIGFWNDKRNKPETDPTDIETDNPLLHFETEGQFNTHCGTKAFIVTRFGDAFMLAGILLLILFTGSFMFTDMAIAENGAFSGLASSGMLILVLGLIFMGAIGKSGQAPLQVWLPEAMAGPTAVSALIHAATMVKAGVYITARFLITIVSSTSPDVQPTVFINPLQVITLEGMVSFFTIVAIIGGITALMTATMGMVSNELKQVLAFSTLSQIGYMMLALGTSGLLAGHGQEGAYLASVLHVISHGAFKALLFLSAGGVIHAVHSKYMTNMGGLRKYMPWTFRVVWVGVFALSGIPPFSGFWSKDSIIEHSYELITEGYLIGYMLFAFAVLAAACTIFYSLRLMGMTFYGPYKGDIQHEAHSADEDSESEDEEHIEHDDEHHATPHDPGAAMMIPLYVLATFTAVAFIVYPAINQIVLNSSETWISIFTDMIVLKFSPEGIVPFVLTISALALGGIPAYIIYIRNADTPNTIIPESGFRRKIFNFLRHRWYINEAYYWILNKFLNFAYWWRERIDNIIIDGIDFKSRDAALTISTKVRWVDDNLVDGFAEAISTKSVSAAETGKQAQTGLVNDYLGMMIFGVGIMILILLVTLGVI
jgi:NADH-quinone oxidoreductase subunit L